MKKSTVNEDVLTMKAFAVRGLTDAEYEHIKERAKNTLPFRVSIRRWKRQYAYGQIDIRPYGKGVYNWTDAEFKVVLKFVEQYGLFFNASRIQKKNWKLCFGNGFTFMGVLCK